MDRKDKLRKDYIYKIESITNVQDINWSDFSLRNLEKLYHSLHYDDLQKEIQWCHEEIKRLEEK